MTLRAASDNQSPEAFHRKARARRKSACAAVKGGGGRLGTVISAGMATMNTVRSMFAGAALLALPAEAQEHRFEDDPVVMVRENFVACDVLSQLQRVMDNPRFLLPASAIRCAQETGSASTQGAVHTSASIRTTRSRPVNGRTRKRWPNKRAQQRLHEIGDRRWRPLKWFRRE